MRHFVKFILDDNGNYNFEKSSGKEIELLGLFLDQLGYPPDKKFVDWMENLSETVFFVKNMEIGFPCERKDDREAIEIRSKHCHEFTINEEVVAFQMSRNEYVKFFWLWHSVIKEKPEKILVMWDRKKITIAQIDRAGKKLVWGEL